MTTDPRQRPRALAFSLVALVALAGCGGNDSEGGGGSGAGAPQKETAVYSDAQPWKANPILSNFPAETNLHNLVGGRLLTGGPDGKAINPELAESYELAPDNRSLAVTLREGLKFSDGSPLTADDVVATFDWQKDQEANIAAGLIEPIESVEAAGDREVTFTFSRAYPRFPTLLATQQFFPIYPAGEPEKKGFFNAPVTAGPYKVESTGGGKQVVLARNENYWGKPGVFREITYRAITDPAARISQLNAGQLDVITGIAAADANDVRSPAKSYIVPWTFGNIYAVTSQKTKLTGQLKIRQAISKAVDREQIAKVVFQGKVKPADSVVPSGMTGYVPSIDIRRDVEGAKRLLQGTDCASGCEISITHVAGRDDYRAIGSILRENLKEIGIDLKVTALEPSVQFEQFFSGEFDMDTVDNYEYADFLDSLLTLGVLSDGGLNGLASFYKNDDVDSAVGRVFQAEGADYEKAAADVQRLWARELPYVPLVNQATTVGSRFGEDSGLFVGPNNLLFVEQREGSGA